MIENAGGTSTSRETPVSLTVYICGGPNPRKVTIMLEELGLPYEVRVIDIYQGEHRSAQFLRVNPNGRLPALHDLEGPEGPLVLYESGAILQYLAEKAARLLPVSGTRRYEVLKWLHLQVSLAPYLGQAHLYRVMYREAMPFDIKRFTIEAKRIYELVNAQLAQSSYVAGEEFSIADIAWYPWLQYARWQGQDVNDYVHLSRWMTLLDQRPAVRRGAAMPWPHTECGPSSAGARALALITARLADPSFALSATDHDAAMANLGI